MRPTIIHSPHTSVVRIIAWLVLTLPLMVVQSFLLIVGWTRASALLPVWYHRTLAYIFGVRIKRIGQVVRKKPTIYVANHTTYFDIMVLGAYVPGRFMAKAEIAKWPLIGWLAKLQRTVFIERRRTVAGDQRQQMIDLLKQRQSLVFFPEGTTGDGNRIMPFKSTLFAALEDHQMSDILVQPVTLAYTAINGMPMGRHMRALLSWMGDVDMVSHPWIVLGLGEVTVELTFHPPIRAGDCTDRKQMASLAEHAVRSGLERSLTGRYQVVDDVKNNPAPVGAL